MDRNPPLLQRPKSPISVGLFLCAWLLVGGLWFFNPQPLALSVALFLNLGVLAFHDYFDYRLPNPYTLTLFGGGLIAVAVLPRFALADHLIGAAVGLIFFPALNFVYLRLRGRIGIGFGDAKMLAGLGLWLGWQTLPPLLLVASLSGLVFALLNHLLGPRAEVDAPMTAAVPFGVFLAVGAWVSWIFL